MRGDRTRAADREDLDRQPQIRKNRDGIDENDIDIGDLAKQLKNKCAAGGTCKDGRIELQGDHKKKVKAVLEEMGFRTEVR